MVVMFEYVFLFEYFDDWFCLQLDLLLFVELLLCFIVGQDGSLSGVEVVGIIVWVVYLVIGVKFMFLKYDLCIVRVLELIEQLFFIEIGLVCLVCVVYLFFDCFCYLFKEVIGSMVF